jgi:hypothetical protein
LKVRSPAVVRGMTNPQLKLPAAFVVEAHAIPPVQFTVTGEDPA